MIKGSFIHTTAEALSERVERRGPQDCWPWTGRLMPNGYGRLYGNGRHDYVHVAAYVEAHGPIPEGHEIDHICHTTDCRQTNLDCIHRRCANPAHLRAVTHRDNNNRGNSPTAINGRRTHCVRGHAFDDANTAITPGGRRRCRACHRDYQRARYQATRRG